MAWIEANPIPADCNACTRQSCYNCDNAGKRWVLSDKEDLLLRRRMLLKAMQRTQKQIEDIDKKLSQIQ